MNCHHCQAPNTSADHRCQRCGRRLDDSSPALQRPAYLHAATARALDYHSESMEAPAPLKETRRPPIQRSLFNTQVVSFESSAPESVEPRRRNRISLRPRTKKPIPGQESFVFDTVITQAQPAPKAPEPAIGCDARVAQQVHRIIAVAFDAGLITGSVALFAGIFFLSGGRVAMDAHAIPFVVGLALFFFLLYEMLWCFAGTDTPGMRFAELHLVNFDGEPPTLDQRLTRVGSRCLSLLAAGLGLAWAWVDEESLTWHDHISKTFPTPIQRYRG
jgi:uncharacterized RDD family membrane protein YckC